MPRLQAVLTGAREVGFTVLSMSLSLIAVFIPILLMGGIVGRYFREFAITLSVAIFVSLLVSLTTTPMMCARFLRHDPERKPGRFFAYSERAFNAMLCLYERTLGWALSQPLLMMFILLMTVCLNVWLYIQVPKGFFPSEDTGVLVGGVQADQSISFQLMAQKMKEFMRIVKSDPAVQNVAGFTGGGQRNGGFMFVALKPLAERRIAADGVISRMRAKLGEVAGAQLFLQPAQDIRVGGRQRSFTYHSALQSDSLDHLRAWGDKIREAFTNLRELADVNSDQAVKGLETQLNFDRATAARLGITTQAIDSALNDAFSQRNASTIYAPLNQYYVIMEVAPQFLQSPEAVKDIYVESRSGKMVPLMLFATFGLGTTPLAVNHQGQFVSSDDLVRAGRRRGLGGRRTRSPGPCLESACRAASMAALPATLGAFQRGTKPAVADPRCFAGDHIVLGVLYEAMHPLVILSTLLSAASAIWGCSSAARSSR